MKKAISLIVTIAAVLLLITCVASAAYQPEECDKWKAAVKVTTATGITAYYENLDPSISEWLAEVPGGGTITMLKDVTTLTGQSALKFPFEWNPENPVALDLNGYTVTSGDATSPIYVMGNGHFTLKNGTWIHEGINSIMNLGVNSQAYMDDQGKYYNPTLVMENLFLYNTNKEHGMLLLSKFSRGDVTIKNCTLWGLNDKSHFCAINFENTKDDGSIKLTVADCIIGGTANRGIRIAGGGIVRMKVTNTAFVTDPTVENPGTVMGGSNKLAITGQPLPVKGGSAGADAYGTLVTGWTGTSPKGDVVLSGTATVYGTAPEKTTIPASVVNPDDYAEPPVEDDPVTPGGPVKPGTPVKPGSPVKPVKPGTNGKPVVVAPASSGPDMTMMIIIAAAAVVVVAAAVVVIVVVSKKKKAKKAAQVEE